jgi:polysaccharide biosynthesis/export protein
VNRAIKFANVIMLLGLVFAPQAGRAQKSEEVPQERRAAESQAQENYVIGPNDVLMINVWKEPDITRSLPVRSDGMISLPLAGDIQAAGRTPKQLQQDIAEKLKAYISAPEVAVIVQEIKSKTFNVLGEVARPGSFVISKSTTVLDAIAMAGGFKDFAKKKSIYILRRTADGKQVKLPFNYPDVMKGKSMDQNIELQPNDTVVIP